MLCTGIEMQMQTVKDGSKHGTETPYQYILTNVLNCFITNLQICGFTELPMY